MTPSTCLTNGIAYQSVSKDYISYVSSDLIAKILFNKYVYIYIYKDKYLLIWSRILFIMLIEFKQYHIQIHLRTP